MNERAEAKEDAGNKFGGEGEGGDETGCNRGAIVMTRFRVPG